MVVVQVVYVMEEEVVEVVVEEVVEEVTLSLRPVQC